jgi:ABC-type transport system involved in multi-copper enzyme maturation permease subunit
LAVLASWRLVGVFRRIVRLTGVEITKLFAHKFFPLTLIATVVVALGLGLAGMQFAHTATMGSGSSFTNYGLWVVTSSFALRLGTVLLMVLGAMSVSSEATARTLNTMLARPFHRYEFLSAKVLSLVFATVLVVLAAAATGYVMGGTVPPREAQRQVLMLGGPPRVETGHWSFPSYGDLVDPSYPDVKIASYGQVMGDILLGFALLVIPTLAGACIGFLFGVLFDSAALAIGITVALFVLLEAFKVLLILGNAFSVLNEFVGRFGYTEVVNRITGIMVDAGTGRPWDAVLAGVQVCGFYILGCLAVSFIVFCRRDVSL